MSVLDSGFAQSWYCKWRYEQDEYSEISVQCVIAVSALVFYGSLLHTLEENQNYQKDLIAETMSYPLVGMHLKRFLHGVYVLWKIKFRYLRMIQINK